MKKKPVIKMQLRDRSINTQWGPIKYEEWCRLEAIRRNNGSYLIYSKDLVGLMEGKKKRGDNGKGSIENKSI